MVQYYSGTSDGGATTMSWQPQTTNTAPGQGDVAPTTAPLGTAPSQGGAGAGNPPPPPPANAGGDPNAPPANGGGGGDGGGGTGGGGTGGGGTGGGGLLSGGLAGVLNGLVHDVHNTVETASHDIGLAGTVHGVTHLGEAIGLGEIGGSNLLTDVLEAPSDLLSGNGGTLVNDLVQDVAKIVDASGNLLNGAASDLSAHNGVLDVVDVVAGVVGGVAGSGETGLLQNLVNAIPHDGADSGHDHLIDANVGDLGTGLSLGELNLLDGGSIQVPLVDGLHADALSGLAQTGVLPQLLHGGDVGGGALPEIGTITQLLPDLLDHHDGHFLLG